MRRRIAFVIFVFAVTLLFGASGCSLSNYGKIRMQPYGQARVTIEDLIRNSKNYDVYYYGVARDKPEALLFDPKGDNKTMSVHPWWVKLEDPAIIQNTVDWMWLGVQYQPYVYTIVGPNGDFFAYYYSFRTDAVIKVVDENTLWIDQMSTPSTTPSRWNAAGSPSWR